VNGGRAGGGPGEEPIESPIDGPSAPHKELLQIKGAGVVRGGGAPHLFANAGHLRLL
jgi:hypothetical protein